MDETSETVKVNPGVQASKFKTNRRDFLSIFSPKRFIDGFRKSNDETHSSIGNTELDRRSFLKFIILTAAYLAIGKRISDKDSEEKGISYIKTEDPREYTETAVQQGLMFIANYVANGVFEKLGIPHGNAAMDNDKLLKQLQEQPLATYANLCIAAPIAEELVFRLFPSHSVGEAQGLHMEAGIPSSAIFSLIHNIHKDDYKKLELAKTVPVVQFIDGLFYWYLMREKGYDHAVLAHSINNTVPLVIASLLLKAYPPEKAQRMAKPVLKIA